MLNGEIADGTSTELTVESAADRLAGLFSDDSEESTPREPQSDDEREDAVDDEPSDEGDSEQSPPDEETDDPDEDADSEPQTPQTFRAKVNGEEVEVTLDELLNGYSRTSDYTRKTQELATQRKQAEADFQAVRAERQQYSQGLTQIESLLQQALGPEPDWDKLAAENPEEFPKQWAAHQLKQQRLGILAQEQERVRQEELKAQQAEFKTYLNSQREQLLVKLPTWKDAEVAKKEKAELVAYAKEQGYSEEDIGQVADHRVFLMLRKAMLYDKAQKNRPNVQKKIEKVLVTKPGSKDSRPSREVTELTRGKQRLAKTGRVEDAAAVLEKMFDRK